jgi:hypothetical protein
MNAPTQTNVSTTDIPGAVHAFAPSNFTVVPARMFDDLCLGEKMTIIRCEDLCSLTGWLYGRDTSLHRSASERSK